jgi:hypothetical protein
VRRRVRHLRERLDELLLGAVEVLELLDEQVVKVLKLHESPFRLRGSRVERATAQRGYGGNLYEVLTPERPEIGRILACG